MIRGERARKVGREEAHKAQETDGRFCHGAPTRRKQETADGGRRSASEELKAERGERGQNGVVERSGVGRALRARLNASRYDSPICRPRSGRPTSSPRIVLGLSPVLLNRMRILQETNRVKTETSPFRLGSTSVFLLCHQADKSFAPETDGQRTDR